MATWRYLQVEPIYYDWIATHDFKESHKDYRNSLEIKAERVETNTSKTFHCVATMALAFGLLFSTLVRQCLEGMMEEQIMHDIV